MKYQDYQLMSKEIKIKIVPQLRFPKFKKNGEWEDEELENVAIFLKGKGISKSDVHINGSLPCIRYGELYTHYKEIISSTKSFTNIPSDQLVLSEANDVIIPASGETREDIAIASCVTKSGIALGGDINILRSKINGAFLAYYLTHAKKKSIAKLAQGDAVVHLYSSQLKKLKINFPLSNQEQQYIADCLSSLDELITAQSQKLEELKVYKKGLMQQLFPTEGETVPKLRFPEFRGSGEWLVSPLKDIFTIFQGFAFSSIDSVNEGVRWLKIADVGIQKMNHDTPSFLPTEYKERYKNFLVKEGDYVIALTRPILNKELKIARVDSFLHESLLNQRVGKLITNNNLDFVYCLLQTSKLISSIEKNIAGSEPPNLSAQQIADIEIYIPAILEEQQKIANCLLSLDDVIKKQTEKMELLKFHKKGLMQQLFPL